MLDFSHAIEGWQCSSTPWLSRNLLKFMHWNMNSIIVHDDIRVPLIKSYNIIQHYDLIAITETALPIK